MDNKGHFKNPERMKAILMSLMSVIIFLLGCGRVNQPESEFQITHIDQSFLNSDSALDIFGECYSIQYKLPSAFEKKVCLGLKDSIIYIRTQDMLKNCPIIIPVHDLKRPNEPIYFYGSDCESLKQRVVWSVRDTSISHGDSNILRLTINLTPSHLEIGDSAPVFERFMQLRKEAEGFKLIYWYEDSTQIEDNLGSWSF